MAAALRAFTKAEVEAQVNAIDVPEDDARLLRYAVATKAQLLRLLWKAGLPAEPLDEALQEADQPRQGQPALVPRAAAAASELSLAQQRDAGQALLHSMAHGHHLAEEFRLCLQDSRKVPREVRDAVDRARSLLSPSGQLCVDRAEKGTPIAEDDFGRNEVFQLAQAYLFVLAVIDGRNVGPTISSERSVQLRHFMAWHKANTEPRQRFTAEQGAWAASLGVADVLPAGGGGGGGGVRNGARNHRGSGGRQQGGAPAAAANGGGVLATPRRCYICNQPGHVRNECPERKRQRNH